MTDVPSGTGLNGFIAGLACHGIEVVHRDSLVVYVLEPISGVRAGQPVETGVETGELAGWPTAPPHWIHVPNELNIPGGQPPSLAGWSRYSRPHPGRLDAAVSPAGAWIAHVRQFLGQAA